MLFSKKIMPIYGEKFLLINIFLIGLFFDCCRAQQLPKDDHHEEIAERENKTINRPIFFFQDNREEIDLSLAKSDSVVRTLQIAVNKEIGPIIASGCLLKSIDVPAGNVIKRINTSSLFLIISRNYIASEVKKVRNISEMDLDLGEDDVDKIEDFFEDFQQCSHLELALGLKINHMKNEKLDGPFEGKKDEDISTLLFNKEAALSSIFCMNSDYSAIKGDDIPCPKWAVFFGGHGFPVIDRYKGDESATGLICGMSLKTFSLVLDFFASRVLTRIFTYLSCYAGGINSSTVYGEDLFESSKKFSFPLMCISLTDLPVGVKATQEKRENGLLKFRDEIIKDGPFNYYELVKNLVAPEESFIQYVASNALVRNPGTTWFSPVGERILVIGKVLAETRTRPLDIATFFGKRGRSSGMSILLYADNIQFDLIVDDSDSSHLDHFVSMIPGNAAHRIKKISIRTEDVCKDRAKLSVFRLFMNTSYFFSKTFLIDEVEVLGDGKVDALIKNVLIVTDPMVKEQNACYVMFTQEVPSEDATLYRVNAVSFLDGSFEFKGDPQRVKIERIARFYHSTIKRIQNRTHNKKDH